MIPTFQVTFTFKSYYDKSMIHLDFNSLVFINISKWRLKELRVLFLHNVLKFVDSYKLRVKCLSSLSFSSLSFSLSLSISLSLFLSFFCFWFSWPTFSLCSNWLCFCFQIRSSLVTDIFECFFHTSLFQCCLSFFSFSPIMTTV